MKESPSDERITLRLPGDLLQRYQSVAGHLGVSLSELVRNAMVLGLPVSGPTEFIMSEQPDGSRGPRRRNAFDLNYPKV